MRRFHSYGPVDKDLHFSLERRYLIDHCADELIGDADKSGHYFTIWASRQAGKTWLLREAKKEIAKRYKDKFTIFSFSLGNLRGIKYTYSQYSEKMALPTGLNVSNWER